ncbi:MAG TPA: DUF5916 domain-containing protein [Gemmatimonadales bacterium]|nr:DUF5916 domain-containing protein [Gemmatimonadales bacterium]
MTPCPPRRRARSLSSMLLVLLAAIAAPLAARGRPTGRLKPGTKQIQARRIKGKPPVIDGRLNDPAWKQAEWISDFLDRDPIEGAVPSESTKVAFMFDGNALYVGARMYSKNPKDIVRGVTQRDQASNTERLIIWLDTYLDRRTAYSFGVTAAGTRLDFYQPSDAAYRRDYSYNPVWQAAAHVDSLGWTAEMRIPFSQLRFNDHPRQVWGININRYIPNRNEDIYWIVVPKDATGWSSWFGNLEGINGIKPTRRIELLPYVTADGMVRGAPDPNDPFHGKTTGHLRTGGNLKMGLGPSLTLAATVNPDFGQVNADPAVVNLSAYEVFFPEQRPFFTAGSQLLTGDGPSYFYSRRIGGPPHLTPSADYVDAPKNATILGAAKVTGRLASGLSLGALGAVTGRATARTFTAPDSFGTEVVEPPTGYGVVRLQQEFGASASTAGITLTGVERSLTAGSALADYLDRTAVTGGGDWALRFDDGEYQLNGYAGFSHVAGDSLAIARLQTSSARYYQRPDAHYVTLDSSRTQLDGYTAALGFSRNAGHHWLWGVSGSVETPGFELNDLGRLHTADDISTGVSVHYRENTPGSVFRNYQISTHVGSNWNFGGVHRGLNGGVGVGATFLNYLNWSVNFGWSARGQSDGATRGGPLMGTGAGWSASTHVSSSWSAPYQVGGNLAYSRNELGGWSYGVSANFGAQPGGRWTLSIDPRYSRWRDTRQYVTTLDGGPAATYGERYIFATVDRSELAAQFRLTYTFTPDLSIQAYAEPFTSSGAYSDYGQLSAPRQRTLLRYGTSGTTITKQADGSRTVTDGASAFTLGNNDFTVGSFRSNFVLRWQYRPGSTLYVVWQQNRSTSSSTGQPVTPSNLVDALTATGDNFFAVKLNYWLPVGT